MDLIFADVDGKRHIKQEALQLGFLAALSAIYETRKIKIHGHKEFSIEISSGHKAKQIFCVCAAVMSVPSVKDACGYQARAKSNACTQKIATRLRKDKEREVVREHTSLLQNSRLETLCYWQVSRFLSFAKSLFEGRTSLSRMG